MAEPRKRKRRVRIDVRDLHGVWLGNWEDVEYADPAEDPPRFGAIEIAAVVLAALVFAFLVVATSGIV